MTLAKCLKQKYASGAAEWQAGTIELVIIQTRVAESTCRAKEVTYGELPGFACGADLEQRRIALSTDDLQHAGPVVEEPLAKAGYRPA